MTLGFLSNSFFGGLAFRMLLFLSLAMLPIGLIAVSQTLQIADQSERNAELSLITMTEEAVVNKRTTLQEALGAGRALGSVVRLSMDDPARCSDFLKAYKEESSSYRLVGYVRPDGIMECSSTSERYDLSSSATYVDAIERGVRTVRTVERGAVSNARVTVVTVPVIIDGRASGFVFVSIEREALEENEPPDGALTPLSLVTFSDTGQIITSERDAAVTAAELPAGVALRVLTDGGRQVFRSENAQGIERVYTVNPMVPGIVTALGVWPVDTPLLVTDFSGRASSLLPIAMWLASLIVAFWALNRLAITHIRKLGRQMRHFALNRTLPRLPLGERVPHEIVAMEQSFLVMANSILHDEARLEDSLREKNILLKEVHHRVKNNLQLISSIMNMQIRQAPTEANRRVLQRLQDRILSLATVHKSLYQDNEMTRANGEVLLREIVSRSIAVGMAPHAGVEVIEDYDEIYLGPDDAPALSLLVSEAVTNALKYVPQNRTSNAQIRVSLKLIDPERALLRVVNTTGGEPPDGGTGLGSKLIDAFARQLSGTLEISETDGEYILELAFPVPLSGKEVYDY